MKKSYFLLLILLSLFFLPKTTKALTITQIKYWDANLNLLYEGGGNESTANRQNVKYIRVYFTHDYTANTNLTLNYTYQITGVGGQPYVTWEQNKSGVFVYGTNKDYSPDNTRIINAYQTGANSYYRNINTDFTWVQTDGGSLASFVSLYLTDPMRITYFKVDDLSIRVNGTSSNITQGDINNIINNNNSNTSSIISNNNNNTNRILEGQQETTDAVNDLNDTLQDTNISDTTIGDKVGDISSISETPITDLLTMPLTLLSAIFNGMDGSCSPYTLPFTLWGNTSQNVVLPCFNGSIYFGSAWSIIDGLFCLFMLYNIGMMVVQFFENITSLRDTFDDMYVPQHTYHPKHGGGN